MFGVIKHALHEYRKILFRDFENEYTYALQSVVRNHANVGFKYYCEVWLEVDIHSKHKITFDSAHNAVLCTWKNYEETGWLCYHSLRILFKTQ